MSTNVTSIIKFTLSFTLPPPLSVSKRRPSRCSQTPRCATRPLPTLCLTAVTTALLLLPPAAHSKDILSSNTIFRRYILTDPEAILRYSLPLPTEQPNLPPPPIREAQELLERLGVSLRSRGAAGLIAGRRDITGLNQLLSLHRLDILLDVPAKKRSEAADRLSRIESMLTDMQTELGLEYVDASLPSVFPRPLLDARDVVQDVLESRNRASQRTNYDATVIESLRLQMLRYIGDIEYMAVEGSGLPYKIPRRFNRYARLTGRATAEMRVRKGKGHVWRNTNMKQDEIGVITAVLDGYSAPLTAGNFVDIAQSGYYDHTRVLSSSRNFFVQLGEKEDDDEEGYIGKRGTKRREIPLEILVRGERVPNYGATLDEFGIADMGVVLPVSGFGALAMVHSVENANDASCQFYIFTGRGRESVLTGSLGTFGYVVKGGAVLGEIEAGDEIVSVRIVSGADGLVLGEK